MDKRNNYFFFQSLHLILSRVSLGFSGVLFWWAASRLYTIEDIGLGSVLISTSSLLIFFSSLGIIPAFIRFLPENKDKGKLLVTLLAFSLFLLILFFLIFLLAAGLFLPKLDFLTESFYPFLFFVFIVSMQIFQVLDGIYLAFKSTNLVLFKNVIQNFLRIALLLFTISLGGFGIFSSNCLTAIVATVVSIVYFIRKHYNLRFRFGVDFSILKKLLPFSLVNFINGISFNLPGLVFPLVVFSLYSEKEAGLFYIPWMIFFVFCSFIISVNNVFLMRVSHGENIKKSFKKVLLFSFSLGIIGFVVFSSWGDRILLIFKKDFSQNSFLILKILFYSIFFFIINQVYITVLNIYKQIRKVGTIATVIVCGMIVFAILLLPRMKSEGIALAWLFSNLLGNICVFVALAKEKQIQSLLNSS